MDVKLVFLLACGLLLICLCGAEEKDSDALLTKDKTEESVPEITITNNAEGGGTKITLTESKNKESESKVTTTDGDAEVTITEDVEEDKPDTTTTDEKVEEAGVGKTGGKESEPEITESNKKAEENAPIVTITDGKLRGKILQSYSGKPIYAFLGIPYAGPPTGPFRFLPPRPPKPWDEIRDATKEGDRCPQFSYPEKIYEGNEDCLYLNVYTNRLPSVESKQTSQQDVIIVIHAGGFTHGSGDLVMYGPDYLLDHDVVMVTFNYRLGALGFLATGDEYAPGNYGLKDQVDVMRWVQRNIHNFSGNPNKVTLLGAHAGGASVHYHLLSALSRNFFHRGISQSGTALSPWAHVSAETAKQRAMKLGQLVGCKKDDLKSTDRLVRCLQKKSEKELVEMSAKILPHLRDYTYPFVPVEEEAVPPRMKALLQDKPIEIMKKPLPGLWKIPWLVSVTSHEGLPQSLEAMVYSDLMEGLNEYPEKYVPFYLGLDIEPKEKSEQIARKIWDFYFKNDTLFYGSLKKLAKMISDFSYYHGLVKSVNTFVAASDMPIFVYYLSYNRRDPRISLGVPQGDDTLYIFPDIVGGKKLLTEKEHFHMTERLLRIVTNFASTGNPTPKESPELDNILWPDVATDDFQYVDIGKKLTIKKGLYPRRIQFWDTIHKMIDEHVEPTATTSKDEL